MERKIGETFEFEGKTLQVKETSRYSCDGCFFNGHCEHSSNLIIGLCEKDQREDEKNVIFVEVQEQPQEQAEQPQTEQPPQKLNLCEILKDCPMYEPFWSPMLGDVKFHHIDHEAKRILITLKTGTQWNINPDATITFANVTSPEIMLYPSKEQRDWFKFTAPWLNKERFDPKTFKAFDRVLVKDEYSEIWNCDLFSHIDNDESYKYFTISTCWNYCIPYNDDTKHLVGTTEEAPDFYRYWEE